MNKFGHVVFIILFNDQFIFCLLVSVFNPLFVEVHMEKIHLLRPEDPGQYPEYGCNNNNDNLLYFFFTAKVQICYNIH